MDHQAFAQLLGNYGEFVGAIAVVITLAYLAVQIRQNTLAMEQNAEREVLNDAQRWRQNLIRHSEIGGTEHWEREKHRYPGEFVTYLDGLRNGAVDK